MTFDQIKESLKVRCCAVRKNWIGTHLFIFLRKGKFIKNVNKDSPIFHGISHTEFDNSYHICVLDFNKNCVIWRPSQVDINAEDWEILKKELN